MTSQSFKRIRIAFFALAAVTAIASLSAQSSAQTASQSNITVKVSGFRNTEGNLRVQLRSGPGTVVQHKVVDIDAKTMTAEAVFNEVPAGTYGVAVFHDENKNGQLDFSSMGMPLEGYGHSNNPAKRPGEPSFDETKFSLTQPTATIDISLIYWP